MKKNYLWAVLAGMVLAGCVSDENSPVGETQKLMTFDTPVFKTQSRAGVLGEIIGTTYPKEESFKVYAYSYIGAYKGEATADYKSYFDSNGEIASASKDYWNTTNAHYWPDAAHNLAFVAYSPNYAKFTSVSHEKNTGLQFTGFETESVSDNQYDLMFSNRVLDRNVTNNGSGAVSLVFNHALSSIVFSAYRDENSPSTTITDIKISGTFFTKGDFSQGISGTTTDGVYSEKATPAWSFTSYTASSQNYDPTFTAFVVPYDNPAIFTSGISALLMIPQTVPTDAAVTVTYTTESGAGTGLSNVKTIPLNSFIVQSTGQPVTNWEMGKRYIYRIQFGATSRIYFEPTVIDWKQQETAIATISSGAGAVVTP